MKAGIFKAYDIRGIYPQELNEESAYKIGMAFVSFLGEGKKTVVVSRDMRLSSPALSKKVIEGITDMGADVLDIGLSSTPTFYYAVGKLKADGGIQVSASHNPKDYNGMKIVKENAYPVGLANGLDKIRDMAAGEIKKAEKKGSIEHVENILQDVVDYSMNLYEFRPLKSFRVVADAANSMGAPDLEALFEKIPCELIKMNFEPDGTFPAHEADPLKPENNQALQEAVVKEGADLGIATDGDGDRIFFTDEKGNMIEPAIVRGMLAEYVLRFNPGAPIGYDIRPGMITRDMIEEAGGRPFITKVGHSLIKLEAMKHDAPFAGESSGHFFFKNRYGIYEMPLVVTMIMLEEMSEKNKAVSEIVRPLQRYFHSGEINSKVKDTHQTLKDVEEAFREGALNVSRLDGILIEHEDYWLNVRGSNTEPKVRMNLEARSKEKMEEMRDKVLAVIRS